MAVSENEAWSWAEQGKVEATARVYLAEKYAKEADLPIPDRKGILGLAQSKSAAEV